MAALLHAAAHDLSFRPSPQNDLDGLLQPEIWPYRPILPMKRYHPTRMFGVVHEHHVGVVFLISLDDVLGQLPGDLEELLKAAPAERFSSWPEMLAAGWLCD